jgi:hypothetical protein
MNDNDTTREALSDSALIGSHAGLGLAPERAEWVRAWFAERYADSGVFDDGAEALTLEAACQLVADVQAAERERWIGPARAMVAAHDAGMVRLNTAMRAQGVRAITLPAEAADELRAIQALRDLVGPNARLSGGP